MIGGAVGCHNGGNDTKDLSRFDSSYFHFRMNNEQLPDCCLPDPSKKASWTRVGGFVLAIFGLYLFLDKTGLARFSPQVGAAVGLGSVVAIGLASTLSSCGALVTGLVAASAKPLSFHLRFHAGRLIGFALLGAVLGWIGQSLSFSPSISGALVLAVAVIMLAYAAKMLGLIPAQWLAFKAPAFIANLTDRPAMLGAATFFLPCGFTQSMQLYAATTGDPFQGALIMALYAVGAAPPLVAVGMAASSGKKRSRHFTTAAGVLIATLGIFNAQNGLTLLGATAPSAPSSPSTPSAVVNGEQVIQMEVSDYGTYEPNVFTVQAGIPVRWQIQGSDSMACLSSLLYGEGGVRTSLKEGLNEIRFTPKRTGRFAFSCSMGMARGTMIVQ